MPDNQPMTWSRTRTSLCYEYQGIEINFAGTTQNSLYQRQIKKSTFPKFPGTTIYSVHSAVEIIDVKLERSFPDDQ